MFFFHRLNMTLRRWLLIGYYKFIFGKKVIFKRGFRSRGCFSLFVTDKAQIVFGKNVFVNNGLSISANKSVVIGDNSILGENVKIYDQNHRFRNKKVTISKQGFNTSEVSIGENCWIGSNVTILKGVHIGNNSIVGANCLIYKDIPENSIVKLHEELTITTY
ncbi:transferase [Lactiplantibacillus plantarum]|nr:transferase [Lactiplantibacillus plantarum]